MQQQQERASGQEHQRQEKPGKGPSAIRVLRHPAMLRLWIAQIIYLSSQSTASYIMIIHTTNETRSATLVGLVLIALTLPPFLLSAPAGALVDRLERRRVLWVSNVLRAISTALFVLVLLVAPHAAFAIYPLALLFALVGLSFTPAEGAIIPMLVEDDELLPAFSLYNLTVNVTQVIGLLVIGPLVLNFLPGFRVPVSPHHHLTITPVVILFAGVAAAYLLAAALIRSLPREQPRSHHSLEDLVTLEAEDTPQEANPLTETLAGTVEPSIFNWSRMQADLREGWLLVKQDPMLLTTVLQACFGTLMMLTVAELATFFVKDLLLLPTRDTALIFTPAGIGLVVGALLVPITVRHLGQTRTITLGMFSMAAGLILLPVAQRLAQMAEPFFWNHAIWFLAIVALLTTLIGFGLDFVIVPAQACMQERSPASMRGRVLALYQALFNGGSIPVILFMGALTDLVGIVIVIYLLGAISLAAGLFTIWRAMHSRHDGSDQESSACFDGFDQQQDQPQNPLNEEIATH